MPNPEHMPRIELEPVESSRLDELKDALRTEIALGKEIGIEVSGIVRDEALGDNAEPVFSYQPQLEMFMASGGKLFIAEALRDAQIPPGMRFTWRGDLITPGAGSFDQPAESDDRIYTASVAQALEAMLAESANTPVRIVAEEFGPDFFNESYEAMGLEARVIPTDNGRFYMWESTAEEVLGSMRRLALPDDPNDPLSKTLADALWSSRGRRHGILRHVRRSSRLQAATKTADYNREPIDPENPDGPYRVKTNVRHDIGIVRDDKRHMLSYAICTSTESDENRKYADWLVAKVGAEVARTVGWAPGLVGRLATRTMYRRPS